MALTPNKDISTYQAYPVPNPNSCHSHQKINIQGGSGLLGKGNHIVYTYISYSRTQNDTYIALTPNKDISTYQASPVPNPNRCHSCQKFNIRGVSGLLGKGNDILYA